jgi:hypothetical protein
MPAKHSPRLTESPYKNTILELPPHYKDLNKLFKALELACGFLERRDQSCTFDKVQQAIQDTCKRYIDKPVG